MAWFYWIWYRLGGLEGPAADLAILGRLPNLLGGMHSSRAASTSSASAEPSSLRTGVARYAHDDLAVHELLEVDLGIGPGGHGHAVLMRCSTSLGFTSASRRARSRHPQLSRSGTTAPDSTTLFGTRMLSSPLASVVVEQAERGHGPLDLAGHAAGVHAHAVADSERAGAQRDRPGDQVADRLLGRETQDHAVMAPPTASVSGRSPASRSAKITLSISVEQADQEADRPGRAGSSHLSSVGRRRGRGSSRRTSRGSRARSRIRCAPGGRRRTARHYASRRGRPQ